MVEDLLIYETGNGGDLALLGEDIATTSNITNLVYLALFGGNVEENTTEETALQLTREDWWGNELFNLDFNSNTERTLQNVSLNSAGIRKIEDAVKKDLLFLNEIGTTEVNVSLISHTKVRIFVKFIQKNEKQININYIYSSEKIEIIEREIL